MLKLFRGDVMVNQGNVEKLFDCLDQSAILYYEKIKLPYLDGLVKTCENIVSNSVVEEDKELKDGLLDRIDTIKDIDFDKEEIRKAFQYACLRGLKHQNISNQMITPESIGIFFSYLVNKLYDTKKKIILDPLIGSGNLITSLANNIDSDVELLGVEMEHTYYKLSQALFGLLEYQENVFFQDVMTFSNVVADLLVTDFSGLDQDGIYRIIIHMHELLKSNGFFISVIDNSFFYAESLKDFIAEVKDKWHFFGMIVLPDAIFKNNKKSIFILQKIGEDFIKPEKFLVADIPDFNNQAEMIKVINQLNDWFERIEFYRVRDNDEKNYGG
jgi:site-specific DNA-methyltransferase (adenine-specific)